MRTRAWSSRCGRERREARDGPHVDAWPLGDESHIDVADEVAALAHALVGLKHEDLRVGAAQPRVVVGEELPNVRQGERAKDGVDDRVVDDVAVRVCDAAKLEVRSVAAVETDAADHQRLSGLLSWRHSMDVIAVPDPEKRLGTQRSGDGIDAARSAHHR